jgi:hypothetical protein
LGVNNQDDNYFIPSGRRTNGLDYHDYSLYSRPTQSSPFKSGANTLNILNNTFNNNANHLNTNEEIPSPFNEMTIYQLCSWLCKNPNVLQLANNMHLSMQTPVVKGSQFIPSISAAGSITTSNQENKSKVCRDFLEELKCLFLRVRNPPKRAFEELIRQVLKCELNSAEGIEWLHTTIRHFGDFRHKLVNSIESLV